jgi:hypothetical protein
MAAILQVQSGNPVNIVTTNSTFTGVVNTLRPDVTGPIAILGTVDRWFDTTVFMPVMGFGNLGRNVVIGRGSIIRTFDAKRTDLREGCGWSCGWVFGLLNMQPPLAGTPESGVWSHRDTVFRQRIRSRGNSSLALNLRSSKSMRSAPC